MYGVPAELNLTFLHGAELIQVCLSQYQLQFQVHPQGCISVEGGWEFRDSAGDLVDGGARSIDRQAPHQLHRLIGQRVIASEVCSPKWFSLEFEGGDVLRIFDDSEQYESFSIQPGNIFV